MARSPVLAFLEIDRVLSQATRRELLLAAPVFGDLEADNIAPILCTGGTRCELDHLARLLDIWHPFIPEDGSAVLIPRGYFGSPVPSTRIGTWWEVLEFGRARRGVRDTIADVTARTGIDVLMLSTCDATTAADAFGVDGVAGRRAAKRLYGEVIQVLSPGEFARARLLRALRDAHLRCTPRDRNIYVVPDHGGSAAVAWLRRVYENHYSRIVAVTLLDRQASAITAPACELVGAVNSPSLSEVAKQVRRLAGEVRRLSGGRSSS